MFIGGSKFRYKVECGIWESNTYECTISDKSETHKHDVLNEVEIVHQKSVKHGEFFKRAIPKNNKEVKSFAEEPLLRHVNENQNSIKIAR